MHTAGCNSANKMITLNDQIGRDNKNLIAFNPYSKEDRHKMLEQIGSMLPAETEHQKCITLRFNQGAIALIEDKRRRISVRFPNQPCDISAEQQLPEGQRIQPMTPDDDTIAGKMTRYSGHLLPPNAGDMDLLLQGPTGEYLCYVFLSTVVSYGVTDAKHGRGLPATWEQQKKPLVRQLKKGLECLVRAIRRKQDRLKRTKEIFLNPNLKAV